MAKQCRTCVFATDERGRWVNPDLAQMVEGRLMQCSQICHAPRLKGKKETHLCRGTRDRQIEIMYRLGVIEAPTEEAWNKLRRELGI
jgi:hypothetical protein